VFKKYSAAVKAVCETIDAYNCLGPQMSICALTPQKAYLTKQPLFKQWK